MSEQEQGIETRLIDWASTKTKGGLDIKKSIGTNRNKIKAAFTSSPWLYAALRAKAEVFGTFQLSGDTDMTNKLLNDPNTMQSPSDMQEMASIHLDLYGIAYIVKHKETNTLTQLYLLDPCKVTHEKEGIKYQPDEGDLRKKEYKWGEDVVVIKEISYGIADIVSPIISVLSSVELEEMAMRWNKAGIKNGGTAKYAMWFDKKQSKDGMTLAHEQLKKVFNGGANRNKVMMLNTPIGLQKIETDKVDMDFDSLLAEMKERVMRVLRVPAILIGETKDISLANANTSKQVFIENTMQPRARKYAQALGRLLDVKIDYIAPKIQDEDSIRKNIELGVKSKVLTINEIREGLGFPALDSGGDEIVTEEIPETNRRIKRHDIQYKATFLQQYGYWVRQIEMLLPQEFNRQRDEVLEKLNKQFKRDIEDQEKVNIDRRVANSSLWNRLLEGITAIYLNQSKTAQQQLKEAGLDGAIAINDLDKFKKVLEKQKNRLVRVNETTFEKVKQVISKSNANGDSLPKTAKAIKDLFNTFKEPKEGKRSRYETIAQTETLTAINQSRIETYKENDIEQHEWLSAGDERVRESHKISGEVRNIGEDFSNGLSEPGETGAPAEEVINCRCLTTPIV